MHIWHFKSYRIPLQLSIEKDDCKIVAKCENVFYKLIDTKREFIYVCERREMQFHGLCYNIILSSHKLTSHSLFHKWVVLLLSLFTLHKCLFLCIYSQIYCSFNLNSLIMVQQNSQMHTHVWERKRVEET